MNHIAKTLFVAATAFATLAAAAPAIAGDAAGGHWVWTPGPRGAAHWVSDAPRPAESVSADGGHWVQTPGPRGVARWVAGPRGATGMAQARPQHADTGSCAGDAACNAAAGKIG